MRVRRCYHNSNGLGVLIIVAVLAMIFIKLWPVLVIVGLGSAAILGYQKVRARRANDLERGRELLAEKAKRDAEAATVQPGSVADPFCTCPHCGHLGAHMVLRVEDAKTTRTCVLCFKEWTIDHSDPEKPVLVDPKPAPEPKTGASPKQRPAERDMTHAEKMAQVRKCAGCKGIAEHAAAHPVTKNVTCGVCGRVWRPAKKANA